MFRPMRSVIREDDGATSLEYGIMLALAATALSVLLVLAVTGNLL